MLARGLIAADKVFRNTEYKKLRKERYNPFDSGNVSKFENGP